MDVLLLVTIGVITGAVSGINVGLLGVVTDITEVPVAPTELVLFIFEELAAVSPKYAAYKMCCLNKDLSVIN